MADYCDQCRNDVKHGEHQDWCPKRNGGDPAAQTLAQRIGWLEEKVARLAQAAGLPDDWDDD